MPAMTRWTRRPGAVAWSPTPGGWGSGEGGDPNRGTRTCPEFVRNRVGMQNGDLDQIRTEFDGQVRALVPLYDEDV